MKFKSKVAGFQVRVEDSPPLLRREPATGHLQLAAQHQRGIALVITLILLSVITFLAVAFLALSRREKGAVANTTDQTTARLAADTALERAQAQLMANLLGRTNRCAYDLMVSTNYINPLGFNPSLGANLTNVSYADTGGRPLVPGSPNFAQMVANLFYNPRPPVFISTNRFFPSEFRYYLDLNRNGRFDTNGYLPVLDGLGAPILGSAGVPLTNFFVGDPEWVGDLARSDQPHSANNPFVDRWAYLIVPEGKALDLNRIHNQVKLGNSTNPKLEGFLRNQGAGTWEINLAAFLRDLNTNAWTTYSYNPSGSYSFGSAFDDALTLLRYRYGGDFHTLLSVQQHFGAGPALLFFPIYPMDIYGDGPLMTGPDTLLSWNYKPQWPWPGAANPNHFFSPQDLFDATKTSPAFTNRLLQVGLLNDSYDRYTYYNLLAGLGTESSPEPPDLIYHDQLVAALPPAALPATPAPKIDLNYVNLNGVPATNFIDWHNANPVLNAALAGEFFTNVADRFLRDPALAPVPGLSITNIPVWPATNNYYSPAVHRLLQVAANIYDATSPDNFPSVFRPIFTVSNHTVRISGYVYDTDVAHYTSYKLWTDLPSLGAAANGEYPDVIVYGVPPIVGAKRGFPNFNEAALQSFVLVSRSLELRKDRLGGKITQTNQMYVIGLTNVLGLEAWNSYFTNYTRPLDMYFSMDTQTILWNPERILATNWFHLPANAPLLHTVITNWPGYTGYGNSGIQVPAAGGFLTFPNSIYWQDQSGGGTLASLGVGFQPQNRFGFPVPQLWLTTTNQVRYVLVDHITGRIVDLVSLGGLSTFMDISAQLGFNTAATGIAGVWRTNRLGGLGINSPTEGLRWQIEISLGNADSMTADWSSYSLNPISGNDKNKAIDAFRVFCGLSPIYYPEMSGAITNLAMQTPFNPASRIYLNTSWQANDPLVHYTAWDLTDLLRTNDVGLVKPSGVIPPTVLIPNIGQINQRYDPWPVDPSVTNTDLHALDLALKDPMVRRSDDWDFPAYKLPNIGWLGRVHRGTPWQTLYLKSPDVWLADPLAWARWTGDAFVWPSGLADVAALRPISDWAMLEHFTTALSPNATRGQLSVNQANLPAWSAVLSGVLVLTNVASDQTLASNPFAVPQFAWLPIPPVGTDGLLAPLSRIVQGILRERYRTVTANLGGKLVSSYVHPDTTFWRIGDILSVPELTVSSPFLNLSPIQRARGLTDAAYERIPQQILGLLRGDDQPRFVVYAYGQALRPAPGSIVTAGGPFFGLCTNYQIMAETATRSVVRIEHAPPPLPTLWLFPPAQQVLLLRANPPRAVVESYNVLPPD